MCRTEEPPLREVQPTHQAACHFAEDALRSDVGVAHLDEIPEPLARLIANCVVQIVRELEGGAKVPAEVADPR